MGAECSNLSESLDGCQIMDCVSNVKGITSNSASPTDTWLLTFKDGVEYNDEPLKQGFMKIWMSEENTRPKSVYYVAGLNYEKRIYLEVIKRLIDAAVCPNFTRALGGGTNCPHSDFLKGDLISDLYLRRNMAHAYFKLPNRPAIEVDDDYDFKGRDISFMKDYKYDFVISETSDGTTMHDFLKRRYTSDKAFWHIIYQNIMALYVLGLVRLTHNDNHTNNIFIDDRPSTDMTYMVQRGDELSVFTLPSQTKIVKVFDWDRSHSDEIGENTLLQSMDFRNITDSYVQAKDLVKFVCHIVKATTKRFTLRYKLVELMINGSESEISSVMGSLRDDRNCFLTKYLNNGKNIDNDDRIRPVGEVLKLLEDYMIESGYATRTSTIPSELSNVWYVNPDAFTWPGILKDNPFPVASAELVEAREQVKISDLLLKKEEAPAVQFSGVGKPVESWDGDTTESSVLISGGSERDGGLL
jgi:hypothetical protein